MNLTGLPNLLRKINRSRGAAVPVWLQVFVDALYVVDPEHAWMASLLETAYGVLHDLPWFHRFSALHELRGAVKLAKRANANREPSPGDHLKSWVSLWELHR